MGIRSLSIKENAMTKVKRRQLEKRLDSVLRQLHAYKKEREHRKSPSEQLDLTILRYEMMADDITDELCEVGNGKAI